MKTKNELDRCHEAYEESLVSDVETLKSNSELNTNEKLAEMDKLLKNKIELENELKSYYDEVINHFTNLISEYARKTEYVNYKHGRKTRTVNEDAMWLKGLKKTLTPCGFLKFNNVYSNFLVELKKKHHLEEAKKNADRAHEEWTKTFKLRLLIIEKLNEVKPNNLYSELTLERLETLYSDYLLSEREGEDVSFDGCEYCDDYTIGNHRCSCGNRRVSAYYEFYLENDKLKTYLIKEAY